MKHRILIDNGSFIPWSDKDIDVIIVNKADGNTIKIDTREKLVSLIYNLRNVLAFEDGVAKR